MRKRTVAAAVLLAGTGVFCWWWGDGGQHWLAIQTGTCPLQGSCDAGAGPHYGYWSGFGSVFPWSMTILSGIAAGLAVHWHHINCHEPGCWRIGRVHVDDRGTLSCFRHYPEGRPAKGHIHRMHAAHLERLARQEG
jgi:hypothetical protein